MAYSNCENLGKACVHVNMNVMQCKEIAQNEEHGLATIIARAKSQKPSAVSDVFEFNFVSKNTVDSSKGLITPESEANSMRTQRQNKIRRLARKFREQRQKTLGLLAKRSRANQQQQINDEEKQENAMHSNKGLPNVEYTSESSSDDLDMSFLGGVHTNEEKQKEKFTKYSSVSGRKIASEDRMSYLHRSTQLKQNMGDESLLSTGACTEKTANDNL